MLTQEHCPSGNISCRAQLEGDLLKFCANAVALTKDTWSPKPEHHLQRETHPVSQSHDKGSANLMVFFTRTEETVSDVCAWKTRVFILVKSPADIYVHRESATRFCIALWMPTWHLVTQQRTKLCSYSVWAIITALASTADYFKCFWQNVSWRCAELEVALSIQMITCIWVQKGRGSR